MDYKALLKTTECYRLIKKDVLENKPSHAYLILCEDALLLRDIGKFFASLFFPEEKTRLIDNEIFSDVETYPKSDTIKVDDISDLIDKSYVTPFESDRRVFVLANAETMNIPSQNKFLKTLEEPPKNVHIIITATNEYNLLPTFLSRVKKLTIPPFTEKELSYIFKEEDKEKFKLAVIESGGLIKRTEEILNSENHQNLNILADDIIFNMKKSNQVLSFSMQVNKYGVEDFSSLLKILKIKFRDILLTKLNQENLVFNKDMVENYSLATYSVTACLYAIEAINVAEKNLKFNANLSATIDRVLFKFLEGKFLWQR